MSRGYRVGLILVSLQVGRSPALDPGEALGAGAAAARIGALLPGLLPADFGFAQHMSPWDEKHVLRGSPLYMAPEMVCQRQYDARVDLWSVGVILYGESPGPGPNLGPPLRILREGLTGPLLKGANPRDPAGPPHCPQEWAGPGLTLSPPSLPSASLPQKPSSGSPPLPPGHSRSWKRRSGATG